MVRAMFGRELHIIEPRPSCRKGLCGMNKCGITKDLLPLHIDGICSPESKQFVETHLAECQDCSREYELMSMEISDIQDMKDTKSNNADNSVDLNINKYNNYFTVRGGNIVLYVLSVIFLAIFIYLEIFSYSLYFDEMFDVVSWVVLIPLIMLLISTVIAVINSVRDKSDRSRIKTLFLVIIIVISLAGSYCFYRTTSTAGETVRVTNIVSKIHENGAYYLEILNEANGRLIRLECDEQDYNALIADEDVLYEMSYRTIFNQSKGFLKNPIDINDYIDNRA
jgi:hypothetical protein